MLKLARGRLHPDRQPPFDSARPHELRRATARRSVPQCWPSWRAWSAGRLPKPAMVAVDNARTRRERLTRLLVAWRLVIGSLVVAAVVLPLLDVLGRDAARTPRRGSGSAPAGSRRCSATTPARGSRSEPWHYVRRGGGAHARRLGDLRARRHSLGLAGAQAGTPPLPPLAPVRGRGRRLAGAVPVPALPGSRRALRRARRAHGRLGLQADAARRASRSTACATSSAVQSLRRAGRRPAETLDVHGARDRTHHPGNRHRPLRPRDGGHGLALRPQRAGVPGAEESSEREGRCRPAADPTRGDLHRSRVPEPAGGLLAAVRGARLDAAPPAVRWHGALSHRRTGRDRAPRAS